MPDHCRLRTGTNSSGAVDNVSGTLETARTWAIANNTYVYVGIGEYNVSIPDTATAVSRTGRILISTGASMNGTKNYDNTLSPQQSGGVGATAAGWVGDSTQLVQVGKPVRIEDLHCATVSATNGNLARTVADTLVTSTSGSILPFSYPLGPASARYNFSTVICYNPQGAAGVVQSGRL